MTNRAEALANDIAQLVTLPTIYFEVKRVIDSPNSSLADLAKALSMDPALSAKLLRIVNSPFYAQSRPVETITRAVSMLGTHQIHDLTLAASVSSTFAKIPADKMDVATFWKGCVFRAEAVKTLAAQCGLREKERFFIQGLLSDLGHMVLYLKAPAEALQALHVAEAGAEPLHIAERRLLNCDYAQVGSAMLKAWGLPGAIHIPIANQLEPEEGAPHTMDAALLNIAGALAWAEHHGSDPVAGVVKQAWEITSLRPEDMSELMAEVRIGAHQMSEILNGFLSKAA